MAEVKWFDFQVSATDDRFLPWFVMTRYMPHSEILDDQAEEILGSEIHWWLTGPECVGRWHLVEFNTFAGPRTARHQTVLLFETQATYDSFIEQYGAILTYQKATRFELKYRELKTDLERRLEGGQYDLSRLGWRYRRSAAREYLDADKRIKKYRAKWSLLRKRAEEMGFPLEP